MVVLQLEQRTGQQRASYHSGSGQEATVWAGDRGQVPTLCPGDRVYESPAPPSPSAQKLLLDKKPLQTAGATPQALSPPSQIRAWLWQGTLSHYRALLKGSSSGGVTCCLPVAPWIHFNSHYLLPL